MAISALAPHPDPFQCDREYVSGLDEEHVKSNKTSEGAMAEYHNHRHHYYYLASIVVKTFVSHPCGSNKLWHGFFLLPLSAKCIPLWDYVRPAVVMQGASMKILLLYCGYSIRMLQTKPQHKIQSHLTYSVFMIMIVLFLNITKRNNNSWNYWVRL